MSRNVVGTIRACANTAEAAMAQEVDSANRCREEGLAEEEGQHRYAALAIGEIVDGFRDLANALEKDRR